jgi:hypothetical protein
LTLENGFGSAYLSMLPWPVKAQQRYAPAKKSVINMI